jgi:hypothetical protein
MCPPVDVDMTSAHPASANSLHAKPITAPANKRRFGLAASRNKTVLSQDVALDARADSPNTAGKPFAKDESSVAAVVVSSVRVPLATKGCSSAPSPLTGTEVPTSGSCLGPTGTTAAGVLSATKLAPRPFQAPRRSGAAGIMMADGVASLGSPVLSTPATSGRTAGASSSGMDTIVGAPVVATASPAAVDLTMVDSPNEGGAVVQLGSAAGVVSSLHAPASAPSGDSVARSHVSGDGAVASKSDSSSTGVRQPQLHQMRLSDMFGRGGGLDKQVSTAPTGPRVGMSVGIGVGLPGAQSQAVRARPIGLARPKGKVGPGLSRGRGRQL